MKTKYTVEHAGQTFTRSSERPYTHTVVARYDREAYAKHLVLGHGWENREWAQRHSDSVASKGFVNKGWCGRLDLAQKLAAQLGKSEWLKDITIIEVK